MDRGAHFYRCDFQVHTPRDLRWAGPDAVTEEERLAYGRKFVEACRDKGLQAVAITDHHCMAFLPFIRKAADEELAPDGTPWVSVSRLVRCINDPPSSGRRTNWGQRCFPLLSAR
jgi:hypothetical protein